MESLLLSNRENTHLDTILPNKIIDLVLSFNGYVYGTYILWIICHYVPTTLNIYISDDDYDTFIRILNTSSCICDNVEHMIKVDDITEKSCVCKCGENELTLLFNFDDKLDGYEVSFNCIKYSREGITFIDDISDFYYNSSPLMEMIKDTKNEKFRVIKYGRNCDLLKLYESICYYMKCGFESINKLPIFKYDINTDKCVICHDSLKRRYTYKTSCNHYFHILCLLKWREESDKCPICRGTLINEKFIE